MILPEPGSSIHSGLTRHTGRKPPSHLHSPTFPLSSKLRWLQATKSIISGTNTQALTAKADLLKEEMDEAMNKVELCKVRRKRCYDVMSKYHSRPHVY